MFLLPIHGGESLSIAGSQWERWWHCNCSSPMRHSWSVSSNQADWYRERVASHSCGRRALHDTGTREADAAPFLTGRHHDPSVREPVIARVSGHASYHAPFTLPRPDAAPLGLAFALGLPPHPFWDELASGLGLTALVILLVEFVLSGRFLIISRRIGNGRHHAIASACAFLDA